MADGCQAGGGWFGTWFQAVKEKSVSALDFVTKDLDEFTKTMQTDTKAAVSDTTNTIKDKLKNQNTASAATGKVKAGISTILGGITHALSVDSDFDDGTSKKKSSYHETTPYFDKAKARLHAIQIDPSTYLEKPSGSPEVYDKWLLTFDLDKMKGDISELLVCNTELRSLYTQLVPSSVPHSVFWHHYFYKVHQLKEDEKRRAELKKRADDAHKVNEEEFEDDWVDFEGPSSPPEVSPLRGMNPATAMEEITKAEEHIQVNNTVENLEKCSLRTTEEDKDSSGKTEADNSTLVPSSEPEKNEPLQESETNESLVILLEGGQSMMKNELEVKTREKGDTVVVGLGSNTPTPTTSENSKESLDEDWEKDFDLEITEEDLRLAQEAAKNITLDECINSDDEDTDDWENWD